MSARSRLWRILHIVFATIVTGLTQELESPEVLETARPVTPRHVTLPVSFQVRHADHFLLNEAGQDIMYNSSMQSHTQLFIVLRARHPPVVSVGYGTLSAVREIPLEMVRPVQVFQTSLQDLAFDWNVRFFVLTRRVYASSPRVRVLFYVPERDGMEDLGRDTLSCITVYGFWQTQEVRGSCVISTNRNTTCLAEVEPPASWFSPPEGVSSRERRGQSQENLLELYYHPQAAEQGGDDPKCPPVISSPTTPMQRIGSVRLLQDRPGTAALAVLRLGQAVVIQTATKPLQKDDVASFWVHLRSAVDLKFFSLRAKMKKGVSFRTATPSNTLLWDITLDTVSNESVGIICRKRFSVSGKRLGKLQAIMQIDFEVVDVSNQSEVQEVRWELALPKDVTMAGASEGVMTIFTTQKNFIGLAPLVMDTELVNTAVLTGQRVTMPVRTVAVEMDGSVTDVSEFTNCSSTDEEVLKVSDRCDLVYVTGGETKGRVGVLVNFTYSYLSAQLEMKVWAPRLPLDIEVSDTELNMIKSWRIPITSHKRDSSGPACVRSTKPSGGSEEEEEEEESRTHGCTLNFQRSLVRVLAHFVAEGAEPRDPQEYFLGSDWQVDVSELVRSFLKVEDTSIAHLRDGRVLSGQDVGTTSIKVLSPLSDSILAEKSVRVLEERVSITELGLQLVSGLTLTLQLSTGSNRVISATATTQEVLSNPKQEALLSSWLQFSDGSLTPLDIYDSAHYSLIITSLDEAVISVRESPLAVVVVGEGEGALLRAEMTICEVCRKARRKTSLAVGRGSVSVRFQTDSRCSEDVIGDTGRFTSRHRNAHDGDYGNDGEEADGGRKHLPMGCSSSDGEESVSRRTSTRIGSPGRDSTPVENYRDQEQASKVSAGVRKPGNIPDNGSTGNPDSGNDVTEGPGKAPGNLMNYPEQVEVSKREPNDDDYGNDDRADDPLPKRLLVDLEIRAYVLLGVFCLAILIFLVNCLSYLLKVRCKQTSLQVQEHQHSLIWLDSVAELTTDVTGGVLPRAPLPSATVVDSGAAGEPCGTVTRPSCSQVASATGAESLGVEANGSEVTHSPTSKRNRVHFTTFPSLDRQVSPRRVQRQKRAGEGSHFA